MGGIDMKNHVKVDGRLLQTNNKWSHLKERQRLWIHEITMEEHAAYVEKYGRLPLKSGKEAVLDKVYDRINEREMWIPWGEFKTHAGKFIDRRNRKLREAPLRDPAEKSVTSSAPAKAKDES
jgi:hypothetical protein